MELCFPSGCTDSFTFFELNRNCDFLLIWDGNIIHPAICARGNPGKTEHSRISGPRSLIYALRCSYSVHKLAPQINSGFMTQAHWQMLLVNWNHLKLISECHCLQSGYGHAPISSMCGHMLEETLSHKRWNFPQRKNNSTAIILFIILINKEEKNLRGYLIFH